MNYFSPKLIKMSRSLPSDNLPGYEELIPKYSDEELLNVLKRRSYYTKKAADMAIQEAIKRGIIYTEHDLFSEKFREEKLLFSWFPVPQNTEARKKIKKSIIRSLIGTGLIPFVYGAFQIYRGYGEHAEIYVAFGLFWIILSILLTQNKTGWILLSLGVADMAAMVYSFQKLLVSSRAVIEYFILITISLMVLYGLIFLYKISKTESQS